MIRRRSSQFQREGILVRLPRHPPALTLRRFATIDLQESRPVDNYSFMNKTAHQIKNPP